LSGWRGRIVGLVNRGGEDVLVIEVPRVCIEDFVYDLVDRLGNRCESAWNDFRFEERQRRTILLNRI